MSGLFDKHFPSGRTAYPHIRICYAQGKLADRGTLPPIFMSHSSSEMEKAYKIAQMNILAQKIAQERLFCSAKTQC